MGIPVSSYRTELSAHGFDDLVSDWLVIKSFHTSDDWKGAELTEPVN